MATIVFVLDKYYPHSDANTNCAQNVISVLKEKGHKIICLCGAEKPQPPRYEGTVQVRTVLHRSFEARYSKKKTIVGRFIARWAHFFCSLFLLSSFPNTEPRYSRRLAKELGEVCKEEKVDCVVGVFRPFAAIQAMLLHKKKKNAVDIKYIGYYLDVLKGATKPFGIPKALYERLCNRCERKVFPSLDRVLMAENGRRYYDAATDAALAGKFTFVNFPSLVLRETAQEHTATKKRTFVYAGYMDRGYRNPSALIETFQQIYRECADIELHLYGKSNMDEELVEYQKRCSAFLFWHGLVAPEAARSALENADCVVSMGNDIEGIVPSKIFELMGLKKPILHFSPSVADGAVAYVARYPDHCILQKDQGIEAMAKELLEFCQRPIVDISTEMLRTEYKSATPEATAEIITSIIK